MTFACTPAYPKKPAFSNESKLSCSTNHSAQIELYIQSGKVWRVQQAIQKQYQP
jgi:hypothetical protein